MQEPSGDEQDHGKATKFNTRAACQAEPQLQLVDDGPGCPRFEPKVLTFHELQLSVKAMQQAEDIGEATVCTAAVVCWFDVVGTEVSSPIRSFMPIRKWLFPGSLVRLRARVLPD